MAFNDKHTGAYGVIDVTHAKIHAGEHFTYSEFNDIASGGTRLILIGSGDELHFNAEISGEGAGNVALYESPTYSAVGTTVNFINNYRESSNTLTNKIFHTPTISSNGTTLQITRFGGSGGFFGGAAAGSGSTRHEWVFHPDKDYLIKFTNTAGASNELALTVMVYKDGTL